MENNIRLQDIIKHTNLSIPYSDYVSCNKFPKQNKDLLGYIIPLKFRNMYKIDKKEYRNEEEYDPHDIFETNCMIVRCDDVEPFRMIGISEDYKTILVADSRYYTEQVVQYPIQFEEYLLKETKNRYVSKFKLKHFRMNV